MQALVPVPVPCRYGHHDSHQVFLAPTIGLDGGVEAEQTYFTWVRNAPAGVDLKDRESEPATIYRNQLIRAWLPIFARHGAKGWDLCDEAGEPRPFDIDALLEDYALARAVADKASDLYQEAILAPFQNRPATRSPTGQTPDTTSPPHRRTRKPSASR